MKTAMAWGLIGVIVWLLVRPVKHTVTGFHNRVGRLKRQIGRQFGGKEILM